MAWIYRPDGNRMAAGLAAADQSLSAPTIVDGVLYLNTLDGQTIALDPLSGAALWRAPSAAPEMGETLASGPVAAGGRVYVGNAGDEFGVRGALKALDGRSGAALWTRFSTGSDEEVGIGPEFRPLSTDRGPNAGFTTWPSGAWQHGGGSVSGPLVYDPEGPLLFHGAGRPAPQNPEQRPGDNLWTSGIFARDAATGKARWFTALEPHDLHGYGGTGPLLRVDSEWRGAPGKLLVHVGRNGYVYVLDRSTGEILAADPYVPVNASNGFDLSAGRATRAASKAVRVNSMSRDVCPSSSGATSANGAALEPKSGLIYIAASRLCMDFEPRSATYMPGTPFGGANIRLKPPRDVGAGALIAWDMKARRAAWSHDEEFPLSSAPLATAAGLVVYGTADGFVRALDARDGRLLWEHRLPRSVSTSPVLFKSSDGKVRLAVLAGSPLGFGSTDDRDIDPRDATAARGLSNALRSLRPPGEPGGALYVFGMP